MEIKQINAGNLLLRVYEIREEMGKAAARDAAERINSLLAQKGEAGVVFAAAPSQNEPLAYLKAADIDWSKVTAFHMDEYIGLDPAALQGFGNFLRRALFDALPFRGIHYIEGWGDPVRACEKYARLLRDNPPDLVLLGIGENGHQIGRASCRERV